MHIYGIQTLKRFEISTIKVHCQEMIPGLQPIGSDQRISDGGSNDDNDEEEDEEGNYYPWHYKYLKT